MKAKVKVNVNRLINLYGQPYSSLLGIKIKTGRDKEIFKWFVAAMLFGKPIREEQAMATYRVLERKGFISPQAIVKAGWHRILPCMGEGGYTRYDGITTTKLIEVSKKLIKEYQGSMNKIHARAKDAKDLEAKLDEFHGVGPLTVNIFLREMRTVWSKANPEPAQRIKKTARKVGIDLKKFKRKSQKFVQIECALLRVHRLLKQGKALPNI